jgi:hypothetical protein
VFASYCGQGGNPGLRAQPWEKTQLIDVALPSRTAGFASSGTCTLLRVWPTFEVQSEVRRTRSRMRTLKSLALALADVVLGLATLVGCVTIVGMVVGRSGGFRPSAMPTSASVLVLAANVAAVLAGYVATRNPTFSERGIGFALVLALCVGTAVTSADEPPSETWYLGLALFPAIMFGTLLRALRRARVRTRIAVASGAATAVVAAATLTAVLLGSSQPEAQASPLTEGHQRDVEVTPERTNRGLFGVLTDDASPSVRTSEGTSKRAPPD